MTCFIFQYSETREAHLLQDKFQNFYSLLLFSFPEAVAVRDYLKYGRSHKIKTIILSKEDKHKMNEKGAAVKLPTQRF